jgi:hypothetical protein
MNHSEACPNSKTEPRQQYTEADIVHPWWCQRDDSQGRSAWCEVRVPAGDPTDIVGSHYEPVNSLRTMYGEDLAVQLTCEHGAAYATRIALRSSNPEFDETSWSLVAWLEPEEAELLARLLTEAASRRRELAGYR